MQNGWVGRHDPRINFIIGLRCDGLDQWAHILFKHQLKIIILVMVHSLIRINGIRFSLSKLNVFSWRIANSRLPTRINIDNEKGYWLTLLRCPSCDGDLEIESHLFIDCIIAKNLWSDIFVGRSRIQVYCL